MSDIDISKDGELAVIAINRPRQRNAMTLAMWQQVGGLFDTFGADPAVRGIILTGAGGDFSAGADIGEFDQVRADAAQSLAYEQAVDRCSAAIAAAPKPTIAVVDGYCLGGGCHLALACDFRFATPSAIFGIPAARLSIVYGLESTRRLVVLVGLAAAKRILYAAERLSAEEALRIGLIECCAEDAMGEARRFAATMARNAPLSIAGAKTILNGLTAAIGTLDATEVQRIIDAAGDSEDYREGRQAFGEKRPPAFRGR